MKRRVLAAVLATGILAVGTLVDAGQGNIRMTVHNMSNIQTFAGRHFYSDTVEQICVFCHTPHNAQPSVPLWNKVNPTQAFRMYTSSQSLSAAAKAVTAPGPESLLCLSCHDGRTAINVLHNSNVGTPLGNDKEVSIAGKAATDDGLGLPGVQMHIDMGGMGGTYRANIGKTGEATAAQAYAGNNLMDDHPISFSYSVAQGQKPTALKPIETPKAQGFRFYGSNNRMECSTCHDPHVDYGMDYDGNPTLSPTGNTKLKPFLVRDNVGSAMCLACHNK